MSMNSHLVELVRRHNAMEQAILSEQAHPSSDPVRVHELKRKKLTLKDEIERLRRSPMGETKH